MRVVTGVGDSGDSGDSDILIEHIHPCASLTRGGFKRVGRRQSSSGDLDFVVRISTSRSTAHRIEFAAPSNIPKITQRSETYR